MQNCTFEKEKYSNHFQLEPHMSSISRSRTVSYMLCFICPMHDLYFSLTLVIPSHRSSTMNTGLSKNNMYNKLYKLALTSDERCDHSFSAKLFRGVPISLMPTALSLAMKSIKIASGCPRKTNKKTTLNCLFKFLKSWANPELLTYGSQPGAQRSLLAFGFTAVAKKKRGRGKKRKRRDEKVCSLS